MNALGVIAPYKYEGMWVFDDPATGLVREPFVLGIDTMIDRLVASIPNAKAGFRYYSRQFDIEGWLCPALFKYFDQAFLRAR